MLLLLLGLFSPVVQEVHCDLIELNHYEHSSEQTSLDQYVFWRWDEAEAKFVSQGWIKKENASLVVSGGRTQIHATVEGKRFVVVSKKPLMESFSKFDPETRSLNEQQFEDRVNVFFWKAKERHDANR